MTVSELIEIAKKCVRDNEGWNCASCELADDLYCRDKIISVLLDEIKNAEKHIRNITIDEFAERMIALEPSDEYETYAIEQLAKEMKKGSEND